MSSIKRNGGKHTTTYTYETASDGGQTGRVKTVKNGSSSENYTYDTWGNVTKVTENSSQSGKTYAYDAQGQLIREYDPDKKLWFGYKYDAGGNMTEVRSYPAAENGDPEGEGTVIKKFTYGSAWKDQMTAMTMDGTTRNFTYDANGNLLSDGKYTYSWTKGSMLVKVTGDGLEATYTYDASGIRTSKTVNGVKTEYLTAGSSVLSEKKNGKWQHYLYEGSGQLMAIRYKGADYYYIRDGLMCITGLVDANGAVVVNYKYDSWGKLVSITGSMADTLGKDNPYRYKGYYYDDETGMYYISVRYYNPEIARFINTDTEDILDISSHLYDKNLYAYCDNNPIMRKDTGGEFWTIAAGALIGAVISAGIEFGMELAFDGKIDAGSIGLAALSGAAGGALAATGFGYGGQIIGNAAISGVSEVVSQVRSGNRNIKSIAANAGAMAAVGVASVAIGGKGIKAEGTPYRKSIDNLKRVRGNVSKAFSNPKGYRHQINRAIKRHRIMSRTAVKGTTKTFTLASVFSNAAGRFKNFLRRRLIN